MTNINRYNAFESACLQGNIEQVQALLPKELNYRIDFNLSPDGETPLILAIKSKELAVVQYLLAHGADPQLESDVGPIDLVKIHEGIQNEAPLFVAAAQSTTEIANFLISHGVQVNFLTLLGGSPLKAATQRNDLQMVKLLLKHGADPNLYRPSGVLSNIPLFWAAFQCQVDILTDLINYGSDVNVQNTDGETALFWASNEKVARVLLKHGINVQARNTKGQTALTLALKRQRWEMVELLESHGAKEGFVSKVLRFVLTLFKR